MLLRKLHIYISVFIAPSLLFFAGAGAGAFQTFRVPDRKDAPVLLQKLARVHRDDVFAVKPAPPPRKPQAKGDEHARPAAAPAPTPKAKASTAAVKWYFAIVSIGIVTTTILGLWMALAYNREKRLLWGLLIVGAAIPMILLAL